eukprot:1533634-Pyramimonas_sp.AAC.1
MRKVLQTSDKSLDSGSTTGSKTGNESRRLCHTSHSVWKRPRLTSHEPFLARVSDNPCSI